MSKKFKGVWLTPDLLSDTTLTVSEKLIVAYTRSFAQRCFAGDAHIAAMLCLTPKTVANCLSSLRKKGKLKGRDFPKLGSVLPENGNDTSRNREHRSKVEISLEEREIASRKFSHENPEDIQKLISLLAVRGIGELDARRAVDEVIAEVKLGVGEAPRNWLVYCTTRAKRNRAVAAREARAANPPKKAPVSQFGRTYT